MPGGDSNLDFAVRPRHAAGDMRLLDRYLLRELLIPLGYCLGGFLVFWVSFDLLSELDEFQRHRLTGFDVVQYYLVMLPEFLVTVTPIGLLLAMLYTLTNHARHHELTAIRAAGVSLWRLSLAYFAVGTFLSLLVFTLNEFWVPRSEELGERILARHEGAGTARDQGRWVRNLTFHNERQRRLWNIGLYDRETGAMWNVNLDWELENGMRRRMAARYGIFTNGAWTFYGVRQLFYTPFPEPKWEPSDTNQLEMIELSETPSQINSEIRFASLSGARAAKRARLSLREIREYEDLHPALPAAARAKLQTQFHGRLAEPWTNLVVVLMAIPFGAPSGRRNVFVGVAASIFIAFSFFFARWLSLALGTAGYLPPWVAAWLPNVLFASGGLWLTLRVR